MAGVYKDPVKVVIINTQYVETDSMSFKSVVQMLTGKDSKIEMNPKNSSSSPSVFYSNDQPTSGFQTSTKNVPIMGRGLSFRDFDRLLKELPPLDELFRLCAD